MIAATLKGPSYQPINYDFDSIEVFNSLEDVIEALFERYSSNGQRTCAATYLDGSGTDVYYPDFGAGMTFTCYRTTPIDEADEEAVEGRRLEVHTAVHGGWHDYIVTLTESEQGTLTAVVERAGI
jgi:hypothetical protein